MKKFETMPSLHTFVLLINFLTTVSIAQHVPTSFCGKIQIKTPFISPNSNESSTFLNSMILCKSQKLYFRTSLGLFLVSSIDYTTKTLIISHPSSSSSSTRNYVSPSLLAAGFPSSPYTNSLLLFNCSNNKHPPSVSPFLISNCTRFHEYGTASKNQKQKVLKVPYICLTVNNLEKLDMNFHPKDLNCSHYRRIYRRSLENVELGTRISFDIPNPDHVPDLCSQCEKPNGNCGVGLRCLCHAKECKDKVVSFVGSLNPDGNIVLSLLCFVVLMIFWSHY
ncbi:hypothetical protein Pint_31957 [Pistacia integerrima]|uniref:Uncharacterized protein n=1 Tax=Pistacia integerrima TaxID=434235 RepID=A0ACC0XS85_9ROSI|nr:hypothetical protein Pint_31957 [Pistacia integerrima]